jgi:hypothetical protein
MFAPTADLAHRAMRMALTMRGNSRAMFDPTTPP